MPKNGQVSTTIDPYHLFVIDELAELLGKSRSEVIAYMVQAWVSDHQAQVEQAGASLATWRERRTMSR
jgi:metal-responsive CopG/Arc/MetJ family transcriptional regulator